MKISANHTEGHKDHISQRTAQFTFQIAAPQAPHPITWYSTVPKVLAQGLCSLANHFFKILNVNCGWLDIVGPHGPCANTFSIILLSTLFNKR
jgi:hypothetical protein